MSDEKLQIDGVSLSRSGIPIVHEISLTVEPGRILALLGANGAGKSSLVMGVAGQLPLDRGQIILRGQQISKWSTEKRRSKGLAVAPEGHRVLDALSVMDNLRVAASLLPKSDRKAEIAAALDLFPQLADRRDAKASELSGGQKQMIVIAQALVSRPKVLLVDELSLGLSPLIAQRLAETLRNIADRGIGVLLIEQFTGLALSIADEVSVMEHGRIVFAGLPQTLRDDPSILHRAYLANK